MTENKLKISQLLTPLIGGQDYEIKPATIEQIEIFKKKAIEKGVDVNVINQLIDLYQIADNFYYEIVMAFHSCVDETIFELWEDRQLWLGQRDFYTLRWANGKFCLGESGSISFSADFEFDTLLELIEGCIQEIKKTDNYDNHISG